MDWFHGHKGRVIFIYLAGFALMTALVRGATLLYNASPQVRDLESCTNLTPEEQTQEQISAAMELLHDSDAKTRKNATARLGLLGSKAGVASIALAEVLEDPDPAVRICAAQSLGSMGRDASPAVPALMHALRDNNSEVRSRVIETLGKIGPPAQPAVPILTTMLKTTDSNDQSITLFALNQITNPGYYPATSDPRVRTQSPTRLPSPAPVTIQPSTQLLVHPKTWDSL